VISFTKPQNLNGKELRQELLEAKVAITQASTSVIVEGDGLLYLDILDKDADAAAVVVAAHNGTTVAPEPTIADKLASVGLSLDELKAAILGGN